MAYDRIEKIQWDWRIESSYAFEMHNREYHGIDAFIQRTESVYSQYFMKMLDESWKQKQNEMEISM